MTTLAFPSYFNAPNKKQLIAKASAGMIASFSEQRRNVVQAGGCAGLWSLALATFFGHVYTFEPAPDNFKCLLHNIADIPNISAYDYGLSDTRRPAKLSRPWLRAGAWQVDEAGKKMKPRLATSDAEITHDPILDIQTVVLDDFLGDIYLDALVLDVEGSELAVFQGAEKLITHHHPLLWFEFQHNHDALCDWLKAHNYDKPQRMTATDVYSMWKGNHDD